MAKRARPRPSPRRSYHYEEESTPPPKIQPGFSIGSLTNLLAIPILTGVITLTGFYYGTSAKLNQYGEEIKALHVQLDATAHGVAKKNEDEQAARTKIRDDFLTSQVKTNEGIAKLDTRLAVAETQQTIANQQLTKIGDTLEKISSSFRKSAKD